MECAEAKAVKPLRSASHSKMLEHGSLVRGHKALSKMEMFLHEGI